MLLKRLWTLLTRMRVAVWLLVALGIVCLLGSLFPQMPPGARADPVLRSAWLMRAADKLGARAALYRALGLFDVFHSAWFYVPLGLVALSTLVCTLNRIGARWQAFARPRTQISERLFGRLPQQAQFGAGSQEDGVKIARRALRRSGFATRPVNEQRDGMVRLYAERGRFGLLGTLFVHVGLLLLLAATAARGALSWRVEALSLPPGEVVPVARSTSFALRNDGFEAETYPDGAPRDYRAFVTVLEGEHETRYAVVRVNRPLRYRDTKLYLHSVSGVGDPATGATVTLMVVHDPSFPLAVASGLSLLVGLILAFYVPHSQIWVHVDADGEGRMVGTTNRLEPGFARRFGRAVEHLKRPLLGGDSP
jgi:cytochrome c biogenesis protein